VELNGADLEAAIAPSESPRSLPDHITSSARPRRGSQLSYTVEGEILLWRFRFSKLL